MAFTLISRKSRRKQNPAALSSPDANRVIPGWSHMLPALVVAGMLAGCANPCCVSSVAPIVATPTKFLAVGYGSQGSYIQYTQGQQKLMAMRAAQVDAYRNLAEQVHGFRVWGNTAVSAFVTQNDSVRTYVDSFIRGARVVNMTSIGDGNFEATVELSLPSDFADCVRLYTPQCTHHRVALDAAPDVVVTPVVAPSVVYTSP